MLHPQLHFMMLQLTEIQYLIDKIRHFICIPIHHPQLSSYFFRQFTGIQYIFHRTGNQSQRCSKLMRDSGEEMQFKFSQFAFYFHLMFQTVESKQDIYNQSDYPQQYKEIEAKSPWSLPKRR